MDVDLLKRRSGGDPDVVEVRGCCLARVLQDALALSRSGGGQAEKEGEAVGRRVGTTNREEEERGGWMDGRPDERGR